LHHIVQLVVASEQPVSERIRGVCVPPEERLAGPGHPLPCRRDQLRIRRARPSSRHWSIEQGARHPELLVERCLELAEWLTEPSNISQPGAGPRTGMSATAGRPTACSSKNKSTPTMRCSALAASYTRVSEAR